MSKKYYNGPPEKCDICLRKIENVFIDCYVPGVGSWGNICPSCFKDTKARLGTGHGQKYEKQGTEFVKVEG